MFESLLERYFEGEERRPPWLNATLLGGGMVLALTVFRNGGVVGLALLTVIAVYKFGPAALLWIPGAILLAIVSGMLGGLVYGLLRPLRRGGVLGDWISWTIGITVYCITFFGVVSSFGLLGRMSLADPVFWYAMVGVAAAYAGVIAWNSQPDEYVRGPYVPLSADQRQAARRAASKRLWEGTESRLRQREQQYHIFEALPEQRREAARLLHEQLADLDRTEHALRRSIEAQGYGEKELLALLGWREKVTAKLARSGAA